MKSALYIATNSIYHGHGISDVDNDLKIKFR